MEALRKYGTETTIFFPIIIKDTTDFDNTSLPFETGDIKISLDGATPANATNAPYNTGYGVYGLILSAAEMQAKIIIVTMIDDDDGWEDQAVIIQTYGDTLAGLTFDFSVPGATESQLTDANDGIQTELNSIKTTVEGLHNFDPTVDTVNVGAIGDSTDAANKLKAGSNVSIVNMVVGGTLTSTSATTGLTGYEDNQFNKRTLYFTSGVLIGSAVRLTGYTESSGGFFLGLAVVRLCVEAFAGGFEEPSDRFKNVHMSLPSV